MIRVLIPEYNRNFIIKIIILMENVIVLKNARKRKDKKELFPEDPKVLQFTSSVQFVWMGQYILKMYHCLEHLNLKML